MLLNLVRTPPPCLTRLELTLLRIASGRREKDMRQKFADEGSDVQAKSGENTDKSQGAARAISSFIDPGLSWKVRLFSTI